MSADTLLKPVCKPVFGKMATGTIYIYIIYWGHFYIQVHTWETGSLWEGDENNRCRIGIDSGVSPGSD